MPGIPAHHALSEREKKFIREHPKGAPIMMNIMGLAVILMGVGVLGLFGYAIYLLATT